MRPQRAQRRLHYILAKSGSRLALATMGALLICAIIGAYAIALWKIPDWMHLADSKDRHNARFLVVSTAGGVLVVLSLLYTARSYQLSRQGQVTERFSKALERLGSERLEVRLGGIYLLEQVAKDSRNHHQDVVSVLVAYIRERTKKQSHDVNDHAEIQPPSDVQAAITALGRRPCRPERGAINLSSLDLSYLDFSGLDFHGASFFDSIAIKAYFQGTDLRNTDMSQAQLVGAHFEGADLQNARLCSTDIMDTYWLQPDANVKGAFLKGAHIDDELARWFFQNGASLGANYNAMIHEKIVSEKIALQSNKLTAPSEEPETE